jgi:hypothetical protein
MAITLTLIVKRAGFGPYSKFDAGVMAVCRARLKAAVLLGFPDISRLFPVFPGYSNFDSQLTVAIGS